MIVKIRSNQLVFPLLFLLIWVFGGKQNTLSAQCNAEDNGVYVSPFQTGDGRYEFDITPSTNYNLMGLEFCTSDQQTGANCCPPPPSRRCMDLIFAVSDPGNGGPFTDECTGQMMVMTAQGNFTEAFLSINGSNPNGGNVDCNAGIGIGNNHTIIVKFTGQANGDVFVEVIIKDKDGVNIGGVSQMVTPSATPSYAIITLCKPGFGCVEDEFVFGCCNIQSSIALDAGSPSEFCVGGSTTLKFTADQGTPPYKVNYLVDDGVNMSNQMIMVGTNGGPAMAMATLPVSPTTTTTYTIISVEDATGCAVPPSGNASVTVTVNPLPAKFDVTGGGAYCTGGDGVLVGLSGSESGVNYQLKLDGNNTGAPVPGTGAALSFGKQTAAGTYTVKATNATTNCMEDMNGSAMVMVDDLLMGATIISSPYFCPDDPGPVIGLNGSSVNVNYQLSSGGNNLGAPVPGTGGPLVFGSYPNGTYKVVASNGSCMTMTSAVVNRTPGNCSISVPNYCACNAPNNRADVTVKVTAPAGQMWQVVSVIGLYGPNNPYPQITPGTPLTYIGMGMHTLEVTRANDKGFYIKVSNGFSEQEIQVGNPSW